jgi:hypothetical protein
MMRLGFSFFEVFVTEDLLAGDFFFAAILVINI